MVIGKGMVAKRFESFKNDDRFVIFASGVSNSKNRISSEYNREKQLLKSAIESNHDKTLVYFSTCSVYDPEEKESPYVLHKTEIENLIKSQAPQFYIFRVSNLVGRSDNPNTVLNFFVYHILNGINFDLWSNASRNLIDIDDMYEIVDNILQGGLYLNEIINVANPESYPAAEIVKTIEDFWQTEANYISIPRGAPFRIDLSMTLPIIQKLNMRFDRKYLVKLLEKYYRNK
jgi:nucleoside-diphosphate-sugar epimerase